MLLVLAAGDVLAGVELGGGENNALRGSAGNDRIAGMGGDDTLHGASGNDAIYGGRGKDEIYGGAGRDAVLGGAGDDFVEAKDGAPDRVNCGPGRDAVSVDRADLISSDCETVYAG